MEKNDLVQNKRICLILEDDVDRKLRLHQAKLIQNSKSSISYSQTINHALRVAMKMK